MTILLITYFTGVMVGMIAGAALFAAWISPDENHQEQAESR